MTYLTVGIIGTAGRNEDYACLSLKSFNRMVDATVKIFDHFKINTRQLKLVSGGAAWADHVAVELILRGIVPYQNLTIYCPTPFKDGRYVGDNDYAQKTASVTNYHHDKFSEKLGKNSLEDLIFVQRFGSTLDQTSKGFKARNKKVSQFVGTDGLLTAFTFGSGGNDKDFWSVNFYKSYHDSKMAQLKPGGTAHTWDISQCDKAHVRLGGL